ncbi:MAG: hypothetical protein IPN77_30815 [Sandaracinaceae bacterium]|nr:hypothetical protein [Sandaracinaceae bacterium]
MNKVSAKLELRLDLDAAELPGPVRLRLEGAGGPAAGSKMGHRIVSDVTRSQQRNLRDARERLRRLEWCRRCTCPSGAGPASPARSAVRRRLEGLKSQRSEVKRGRGKVQGGKTSRRGVGPVSPGGQRCHDGATAFHQPVSCYPRSRDPRSPDHEPHRRRLHARRLQLRPRWPPRRGPREAVTVPHTRADHRGGSQPARAQPRPRRTEAHRAAGGSCNSARFGWTTCACT